MGIVWQHIDLEVKELCLARVLRCGQTFRWRCIDGIWSCSIRNRVLVLKQETSRVLYASIPPMKDTEDVVRKYFHLDVDLNKLYKDWCSRDARFEATSSLFQGIRVLDQEPWENLVCFICSSNNNVKRISKMCEALCVNYGDKLCSFQGSEHYSFPTPEQLNGDEVESELRDLGFGYRAKFINQTAKMMTKDKYSQLLKLRGSSREECQEFLTQFPGVGPKVADCVSLMSLNQHEVVPIDTHIYQIAKRDYKFRTKSKNKTMTPTVYAEIQQFFVDLWGDYAGWAHSLLFAADLRDLENGINEAKEESPKKKRKTAVATAA